MKDLTICILTHNRGELLLETIDSILNQTCHDFKFVVSDNSSNDDTEKLLKERNLLSKLDYRKRDHEYSSLDHFNMCLAEMDTKYFVLFHDDDIMLPEYVETLYGAINGSAYGAVGCNAYKLYDTKKSTHSFLKCRQNLILTPEKLIIQYCKGDIVPYPSYMYSKSSIGDIQFSADCGKYSDVTWLLNVAKKSMLWIAKPLMYYRIHGGQDSQTIDFVNQYNLLTVFKIILGNNNKYIKHYSNALLYGEVWSKYKSSNELPWTALKQLFIASKYFFIRFMVKCLFKN